MNVGAGPRACPFQLGNTPSCFATEFLEAHASIFFLVFSSRSSCSAMEVLQAPACSWCLLATAATTGSREVWLPPVGNGTGSFQEGIAKQELRDEKGVQIVHPGREVRVWGLQEEVLVIAHEHPREHSPPPPRSHGRQQFQLLPAAQVTVDDLPPLQSPAGQVVDTIGEVDSQRSGHDLKLPVLPLPAKLKSRKLRPDPTTPTTHHLNATI